MGMRYEYHDTASLFPLMQGEEFEAFKADIARNGLRDAIWLHPDGRIIDGRNRYRACVKVGVEPRFRTWDGEGSLVAFIVSMNLHRRHLTSSQRAVIALDVLPMLEVEAKERQGQRTDLQPNIPQKVGESKHKSETAQHAAALFHTNRQYVSQAKRLRDEAPDLLEQVKSGEVTIPQAKQALVRRNQKERTTITPKMPTERYKCIVIDPPWPMKKIEREVRPNQGIHLDYPTMTLDEIAALSIQDVADETGCHVYLWTTHKYLPVALDLFEKWKVRYQCVMTWIKPTGMTPYSWMYNTELVLFGRTGKSLKLTRFGLKLSFEAPVTKHSKKPDIFYERVVQASPGPRLEMFARKPREGFHVWGDEV